MSGTYKANDGDTFSSVAAAVYGDDTQAYFLSTANPTLTQPFKAGTIVQTPDTAQPDSGLKGGELEVIAGTFGVKTLDNFVLVAAIDAIAKGSFTVPNEFETRVIFKPLSMANIKIGFSGKQQLEGYCKVKPNGNVLDVEFAAKCALMEFVNPAITAYPLEFRDLNFQQIVEYLCNPLGLSVVFNALPGSRFSRVDIEHETKILDFVSQLAKQRNFVSTSNEKGALVMQREIEPGLPVARLEVGKFPVTEDVGVEVNEDSYYSIVTGIIEADPKKGKKARYFSVENPHRTSLVRPYNFTAEDIDDGELETCVNTVAGRMFGGVFGLTVTVVSWFDESGSAWKPNTTLEYKDPRNFIDDFYEFVIAEVTFNKTYNSKTATLKLTLPGCYGGRFPEKLPWQK